MRAVAALMALLIEAAVIAPSWFSNPSGPHCSTMSCCAGGEGASCPMHTGSERLTWRTCNPDSDALPRVAGVVFAPPQRAGATFEPLPFSASPDLASPRFLSRPSEPAIPPPRRIA